ncbi:MAG: DUF2996 domain-containing protein [Nostoc sp. DedQUE08]|uniref:DUF2996 domain-containing protein n=1 Tax=unclassified Nostoc TaxID=2593658 RepID=UPI002AD4B594|nr:MULTISPECIES: DUF2996 domain-containing protein [unclassified Nostoc]MDZ8035584.1 DUF2996 domain-containing protein [Nostoc sp. DedSLP04]MDZ8067417.1 DUF2996 domain-containing protein [Nostoc sp. DedQUE08]MDZ8094949.1 DUF2996 domain-containing protein [Nostoc sp. DedQUE05]MDZ8131250.1 DUF2996 domain-containing protein [Nostoc sp. DedQUE07]
MADPTNHNQAGEVAPSTVDKQAPSVAEEHAPSTDSPEATDIPTANAPDPKAANPEDNPNAAKPAAASPKREKPAAAAKAAKAEKPADDDATEEKPAAKAPKKEKAPAVENKPFVEFIEQDYLPALQKAIAQKGVKDLQVSFAKQKMPITGFESAEECWQIIGSWSEIGKRQFNLYFPDEDIQGKKGFSCNEGKKPSTLESFLIDERKITLDLLVYGLVQRLDGQKWLGRN